MRELAFVGLSDDGTALVLRGADGQQYTTPIDERLSAAVRRDRSRLGQLEIAGDALRPRDIQARIRAGATADEIAEAAGWPIERVRRFEAPVLAEREWVASRARATEVPRLDERPSLEEVVSVRLESRGVDPATLTWDAWRREDGRWTVAAAYGEGSGARVAHFVYDAGTSSVHADDDDARWLAEEPPAPAPEPPQPSPHLVAVPAQSVEGYAVDDPVYDPALDPTAPAEAARPSMVEQLLVPEEGPPLARLTRPSEGRRGRRRGPRAAEPQSVPEEPSEVPDEPAAEGEDPETPRRGTRGKRAPVPSWDEILFGTRRPDGD